MKKFALLMAVILALLASGYWLSATLLDSGAIPIPGFLGATATASPTPTESGAMARATQSADSPEETPSPAPAESEAMEEVVRFSRFEFYSGDKQGAWGAVWHVSVDGKAVLRFADDFRTVNGSALEVILIESAKPTRQEIGEGYKLADLKALEGTQEYGIPSDIELDSYRTVAIYGRDLDAVWATAELPEIFPDPVPTPMYTKEELIYVDPAEVGEINLPITPVEKINRTGRSPGIDIEKYRLVVDGAVENPLSLSYKDILAYPEKTDVVLLVCPGFFVDNAQWSGVPVSVILEEAKLKPGAKEVRFHAGSYQSVLTLEEAQREGTYLAHHVNGQVLPEEHGFPLRLVAEGKYGSRWVKWLDRIEIAE
jgi:sulfoxide reductase catalytic subunit YedY